MIPLPVSPPPAPPPTIEHTHTHTMADFLKEPERDERDAYLKHKNWVYSQGWLQDRELWEQYQEDFEKWTVEHFRDANQTHKRKLQYVLRKHGVWVNTSRTKSIAQSLFDSLQGEQPTRWSHAEIKLYLAEHGEFKSNLIDSIIKTGGVIVSFGETIYLTSDQYFERYSKPPVIAQEQLQEQPQDQDQTSDVILQIQEQEQPQVQVQEQPQDQTPSDDVTPRIQKQQQLPRPPFASNSPPTSRDSYELPQAKPIVSRPSQRPPPLPPPSSSKSEHKIEERVARNITSTTPPKAYNFYNSARTTPTTSTTPPIVHNLYNSARITTSTTPQYTLLVPRSLQVNGHPLASASRQLDSITSNHAPWPLPANNLIL